MLYKSFYALFGSLISLLSIEALFEEAPISVIFAHLEKDKIDASSKKASFDTRMRGIQKVHGPHLGSIQWA